MPILPTALTWRPALLIAFESVLIVSSLLTAARLWLGEGAWSPDALATTWPKAVLVAVVCQMSLYYAELYDLRVVADRRELIVRVLQALGAASLVLALTYYILPALIIGRGVFLVASMLVVITVAGWRFAFEWLSVAVGPAERLLVVGGSHAARELALELAQRRKELGVEIVGFADNEATTEGMGFPVLGRVDEIPQIVRDQRVERVVVSLVDARGKLPMERLLDMKLDGVRFDHLSAVYEQYTGKIAVENLRPSYLIFNEGFRTSRLQLFFKRVFDVMLAIFGLLIAWPIMLVVGVAIRLTSPGPALYHQVRVGQNGRLFTVHKFRSMRQDAEAASGAVWAQKNDPRVTAVGLFCRKTRLDELPQLWNVLVGDMSFVGPRPERPEFVDQLSDQIPFYRQRHVVKRGVTGWAQVMYTYGASVEDAVEKLQYDLFYIKHLSVAFDVFVLFKTVQTVVLRRGT
ncbi:Putative undecaprenyl-phosphate N-acetylgalactosaminyl 1-phosphate transferase [Luteitalea pratensis]|uniref:Undecaprenyl-phosphate N-acetylgalactosaminyl 1-phosphate transferase n=1 Tax=Luteitalea pratensis TaxID=1855912 RepID=A0A143PPN4_LUTPR|nr:TIGR03013 family XrtA/PEP-CTERM system glycosyltransferase [Luteitalea pratensis]AMY10090.1 Putative undecaprenyl-phosphate N-acetylgalactosaminyl 1-phosphate transferase [Luteitalea pratensis]